MNGHYVCKTDNGLDRVMASYENGEPREERERTVRTQMPLARGLCRWLAFEDLGIVVDAVRLLDELGIVLASLRVIWPGGALRQEGVRCCPSVNYCYRTGLNVQRLFFVWVFFLVEPETVADAGRTTFETVGPTLNARDDARGRGCRVE